MASLDAEAYASGFTKDMDQDLQKEVCTSVTGYVIIKSFQLMYTLPFLKFNYPCKQVDNVSPKLLMRAGLSKCLLRRFWYDLLTSLLSLCLVWGSAIHINTAIYRYIDSILSTI